MACFVAEAAAAMNDDTRPVARLESVTQVYPRALALDSVSIEVPSGCVVGVIGPDGVGKSTLLSIVAGARQIQSGRVFVLGRDSAAPAHRYAICSRIAYMPQGLGKNLYPDLSVRENIEFFSRLFGQPRAERQWRIGELLSSTGTGAFAPRDPRGPSGAERGEDVFVALPAEQPRARQNRFKVPPRRAMKAESVIVAR